MRSERTGGRGWSLLRSPGFRTVKRHRGFPSVQPRPPKLSVLLRCIGMLGSEWTESGRIESEISDFKSQFSNSPIAFNTFLCALISIASFLLVATIPCVAADKPDTSQAPPETSPAARLEEFKFRDDKGRDRLVLGKVQITAQDGGLLVLGQDGGLWTVEPNQLKARRQFEQNCSPLVPADLGKLLQQERGLDRFQILTTKHYVLCYNTNREYAEWCGGLFERLYAGFYQYWKKHGLTLREPEFPLVAIIFADQKQYAAYATREVGPDVTRALGFYAIGSNRMVLYDHTAGNGKPAKTVAEIQRRLAAAPFNIATVIHEATHQIAFNSGMHVRFADNPLWLTEGMAMFFEPPDLQSETGWTAMGSINPPRLKRFRGNLARRPAGHLTALIQSDALLTNPKTLPDAYAEAWALTYFLLQTRKEAYVDYLKKISGKKVLTWDKPADRLRDFREAFGDDLQELDREFLKYLRSVK